ncbi:PIN domain-containing protein [Methylobacter sp. BBA5.1]|uniref:PIN domain-containing protein n=1 Tax=Methylobacter sp. BBA5.1 TaxID=1495064 RepID=UPI00068B50EB|nr:PIN domain-containing protein [Methylobacter sp. BBA5.1]
MTAPAFVDTNVVVYALGVDTDRRETAIKLLAEGVLVSAQVINETVSVLLGKQKFSREDAYEVAQSLLDLCEVLPVDTETIRAAMHLAAHYSLPHWDALIVASALLAGCDTLYSEDMQHG